MTNEIKTYDESYVYGDFRMGVENPNASAHQQNINTASQSTQEAKSVAEIQAAYLVAKKMPRDEYECSMNIVKSCRRPSLADQAMYAYPRGGQLVTGPSIRLAEVLAQKWKNIRVGIEVISQTPEKTEALAYANDMENNFRVDAGFTVVHQRTTKKGVKRLTDERDIRELVSNIGSRHLRQCILRVIPGDVVEAAIEQCKKTQASSDVPIEERIKKMVTAFDEIGVNVEMLEQRLGHKLSATIATEIVTLISIYNSIKNGMATREQFFEFPNQQAEDAKQELKDIIAKNKKEPKKEKEEKKDEQEKPLDSVESEG